MAEKKGKTLTIPANESERGKALAAALAQIEKRFGKGSIMRLSDSGVDDSIEAVPTGSLGLDLALGIGGLPRGRIVEVFGPESSGKTTLALSVVAQMQKSGGTCAYIDAEHALDIQYAAKLGVNLASLLISQPDAGEQALEITDSLVRSGSVDLIVVDSVAALVPQAEIEGDMGDAAVGLHARLMSQAMRKLAASIQRTKTLVIFINQLRQKIGVMNGPAETTTGGNALKFYSSVRIDIRRTGAIKKGDEVVGNETRVKVVKNKVAAPFRKAAFDILYGSGICREAEIVDIATELGILTRSGAWYSCGAERISQGREKAIQWIRDNPERAAEIEAQIREIKGGRPAAPAQGEDSPADSGLPPPPIDDDGDPEL